MKMHAHHISLALFSLALVSCGDAGEGGGSAQAEAGGKILDRSISDDMLPYDTLQSQPPPAKPKDAGNGAATAGAEDSETEPPTQSNVSDQPEQEAESEGEAGAPAE